MLGCGPPLTGTCGIPAHPDNILHQYNHTSTYVDFARISVSVSLKHAENQVHEIVSYAAGCMDTTDSSIPCIDASSERADYVQLVRKQRGYTREADRLSSRAALIASYLFLLRVLTSLRRQSRAVKSLIL